MSAIVIRFPNRMRGCYYPPQWVVVLIVCAFWIAVGLAIGAILAFTAGAPR